MAGEISVIFRSDGDVLQFNGSEVPTFDTFVSKLQGKLPWISKHPLNFTFELNLNQTCSLNCQADYTNMLLLCNVLQRSVVYIGILIHSSNDRSPTPPQTPSAFPNHRTPSNRPTISHYFTQQHRFPTQDNAAPQIVKTRGTRVPEYLFNEPVYQPASEYGANVNDYAYVSKKKRLKNREFTGEWYPEAQSRPPVTDVAPDEEPVVLRSAIWVDYITHIGQEFIGGMEEFRLKLIKFSAKLVFRFVYLRNDARYIRAECQQKVEEGCQWYVKGTVSNVNGALVIKHGNLKHTCQLAMMTCDSKRMGQRLIGDFITESIRATPILTATDLRRDILKHWGFDITYEKVWRSVEIACANIFGSYDDSFDELRWYSDAILRTNPGSVVALETEPSENRFQRFFLAFDASLKGFKHCRPMLFVDGTFMKTRYKGTLLSATAKDGNNGLFPVAVAIVDSENSANWKWFISKLREHVHHDEDIMFTSDRSGGLLNAFKSFPDQPTHFYCLFHLMKNLRGMYPGKKYSDVFKNYMCKLLKDAAYAPNKIMFAVAVERFKEKGGPQAVHFLEDLPEDKWAVAFSSDAHRYGELTSNAAESFNNWILDARSLPVTFMLDCIRMQLTSWFNERRAAMSEATNALTPRINELWNKRSSKGQHWTVVPSNRNGLFEVLCQPTCVVDLHNRRCGCYQWQVEGFPCVHAISIINKARWGLRHVVHAYFFTDTYKRVYANDIHPVPQTEKFEFIDLNQPCKILPPLHRTNVPGRPKVKRIRSNGESTKKKPKFLCGRCGKYGNHYWTTCGDALN